jgi:CheY-like chemotaxis protein
MPGPAQTPKPGQGAAKAATPAATAQSGRGEIVMVVEDNAEIRVIITRILAQNGYRVEPFCDGKEALGILKDPAVAVDLLLTDIVMAGMSGPEVAAASAELRPGLPVLFMSGYAAELTGTRPLTTESINIIEKPFTQAVLLRRVAEALGRQEGPYEA